MRPMLSAWIVHARCLRRRSSPRALRNTPVHHPRAVPNAEADLPSSFDVRFSRRGPHRHHAPMASKIDTARGTTQGSRRLHAAAAVGGGAHDAIRAGQRWRPQTLRGWLPPPSRIPRSDRGRRDRPVPSIQELAGEKAPLPTGSGARSRFSGHRGLARTTGPRSQIPSVSSPTRIEAEP